MGRPSAPAAPSCHRCNRDAILSCSSLCSALSPSNTVLQASSHALYCMEAASRRCSGTISISVAGLWKTACCKVGMMLLCVSRWPDCLYALALTTASQPLSRSADGSLLMCTPVDVLFLLLPMLERGRQQARSGLPACLPYLHCLLGCCTACGLSFCF